MLPSIGQVDDIPGSYVPVSEFFSEKCVFITGATGFLGKVLVEKLLRSCPGVKVIYLLIRPRRGADPAARLLELLESPLFDVLRKENHSQLEKIVAVQGDISEPHLGLSPSDLSMIMDTVSVVFHCAATVKFNEPLKAAVKVNLRGTNNVLDACKRIKNLKALVHVSTCYSNCHREEVQEVVYPPPHDPERFASCVEETDDKIIEVNTPILVGALPNTHTLTKALAENLVSEAAKILPTAIVRPATVTASWHEPMPGWVQGYGGMTAIVAPYMLGILRSLHCDETKELDIIPVDMVVNTLICAAWKTSLSWCREVIIFNASSGQTNPLSFRRIFEAMNNGVHEYPLLQGYRAPADHIIEKSHFKHTCNKWVYHLLPAYLTDMIAMLTKHPHRLIALQKRVLMGTEEMRFFTTRTFVFKDDNTRMLLKSLSPEDNEKFNFDVSHINWEKYIGDYILGIRTFLLKDKPHTLPQARANTCRTAQWKSTFLTIFAAVVPAMYVLWAN